MGFSIATSASRGLRSALTPTRPTPEGSALAWLADVLDSDVA